MLPFVLLELFAGRHWWVPAGLILWFGISLVWFYITGTRTKKANDLLADSIAASITYDPAMIGDEPSTTWSSTSKTA